MNEASIQEHPDYGFGFYDARDGEPLFDDASVEYEAGWRAFYKCRDIMKRAGFSDDGHGGMTAHKFEQNEHGLWCQVCGEHIAAPWHLADEDFQAPDNCPNCGWPDEFDPESV
jgi:rubrerythrin